MELDSEPNDTRHCFQNTIVLLQNTHASQSNFDAVCKLFARILITSGSLAGTLSQTYFARFPLPSTVVEMVTGKLRTEDIYHHSAFYPLPDHRSTALATAAAMLFVLLEFVPDVLRNEAVGVG